MSSSDGGDGERDGGDWLVVCWVLGGVGFVSVGAEGFVSVDSVGKGAGVDWEDMVLIVVRAGREILSGYGCFSCGQGAIVTFNNSRFLLYWRSRRERDIL